MKHGSTPIGQGALAKELGHLSEIPIPDLIDRWIALYGRRPPRCASRTFLTLAIAWRMQEQTLGGLKPSVRRALARIASETADGQKQSIIPTTRLRAGVRLLRTWQGVTHEVIILEDGVVFQGKQYRSLSEVARTITGVRWSGPRFFGLKKKQAV